MSFILRDGKIASENKNKKFDDMVGYIYPVRKGASSKNPYR